MKTTVTKNMFIEEFRLYGREKQFSKDGLEALYDYIIENENDDFEYELDVIGLCCEFTEYENIQEFQDNYGMDYETINDIEQITVVIKIPETERIIVQNF